SFSSWGQERWLKTLDTPVIQKKIYEEVDINSSIYQKKYPQLKDLRLNADQNTVMNNLIVDCRQPFLRKSKSMIEENNHAITSEGKEVELFCKSGVLKQFRIKAIPFQKIGPKKNQWVKKR
ncbi:MAG: hypothetical protein WCP85_30130, partial [Mariniphaga sp.]